MLRSAKSGLKCEPPGRNHTIVSFFPASHARGSCAGCSNCWGCKHKRCFRLSHFSLEQSPRPVLSADSFQHALPVYWESGD